MAMCFLLLSLFWNATIQAQATRINVGYSAISGNALPAWIAKDAGIFEKNGLDVQLIYFTGGTTAVMALISADTPFTYMAGPAVVNSVLAGSDATVIAGGMTGFGDIAVPKNRQLTNGRGKWTDPPLCFTSILKHLMICLMRMMS